MKNILKIALLPCVAALTIAAAPVSATSVTSSAPTASSASTALSKEAIKLQKQQVKQARKKAKKCAKLAKKMNKTKISESRRAAFKSSWTAMCKPASAAMTGETAKPSAAGSNASGNSAGNANSNAVDHANSASAVIAATTPLFVPAGNTQKSGDSVPVVQLATSGAAAAAVPEPGTLALLGLGLMGLGFTRRRTK